MAVKKNILYFINILIFLCFASYIGSFIISAFFASQEINIILKVILVALIVIVIGACYIIGSAVHEWDLIQDFYAEGAKVRSWEIIIVVCMMVFSICVSVMFYGIQIQISSIVSVIFAVLMIPVVYAAGRKVQDMITGILAAAFCMAIPAGAISGQDGFVFEQGDGLITSCIRGISSITDGGIFINILTRLENITNFSSSLPKLTMCVFFFFSIWAGLFLFVSRKNGGVFLTVYFNVIIVLQVLFDFSDYFFLLIYPAAALTAAMGISFFVHKWIYEEELEKGYDDATESSFEKFSIVDEEDAESELKQVNTGLEKHKNNKIAKEAEKERQDTETENQTNAETENRKQGDIEKKELPEAEEITAEPELFKGEAVKTESADTDMENEDIIEELAVEESHSETGEGLPGDLEHETELTENKAGELENMEKPEAVSENRTEKPGDSEMAESYNTGENITKVQEEIPVREEEAEMLGDESMLLDQEEELLFGSKEQDEEEAAFFAELASSAKETERLKEQVQQAEDELTELTEKYQKQKSQLKDLIQLLEQSKERQKADGQEIVDTRKKIVHLESEIQSLNKGMEEKEALVEEYRERCQEMEDVKNSLAESEQKLARAEEEKSILQKEAETQKEMLQKEAEEKKTVLHEVEEQRAEVEKFRRTSEEHRAEAEKYRQAAETNRFLAEQLKEEAAEARMEAENAKAENSRYKEEAESFRRQAEEYRQQNTSLLGQIDELKVQLEFSSQNNSREELERLKEEKEHLEMDYQNRFEQLQEEKKTLERQYHEEVQKRRELLRRAKEEISRIRNQASKKGFR